MTSAQKLRLLLIRDFIYFAVIACYFFLRNPIGIILFVAVLFFFAKRAEKTLRESDVKLDSSQKRVYFAGTSFYFLLLLGLLLSWILRHSSPPAWAGGSLGIVVLLVLFYASYDAVYGRNAKV
jgi:hypothetical protein